LLAPPLAAAAGALNGAGPAQDLPSANPWAGGLPKEPVDVGFCVVADLPNSNIEHWSRENFEQHVLDPIVTAVRYLA